MAKYDIAYSCGHSAEKQLFGPEKDRQSYIAWAARIGECPACLKADAARRTEAIEMEHALPPLAGSEKQIAWARGIRADLIAKVVAAVQKAKEDASRRTVPLTDEQIRKADEQTAVVMQALYAKTSAGWWIDAREKSPLSLAQAVYKESRQQGRAS